MSNTLLPNVIAENPQQIKFKDLAHHHREMLKCVDREDLEYLNISGCWANITNCSWSILNMGTKEATLRIKESAWKKYEHHYAERKSEKKAPEERVIYSGPATIVVWADGTKTVVKACEGDTFDPVFGYMIAFYQKQTGKSHHQTSKFFTALRKLHAESLPKPKELKTAPIKASKPAKSGKKPAVRKKAKA